MKVNLIIDTNCKICKIKVKDEQANIKETLKRHMKKFTVGGGSSEVLQLHKVYKTPI